MRRGCRCRRGTFGRHLDWLHHQRWRRNWYNLDLEWCCLVCRLHRRRLLPWTGDCCGLRCGWQCGLQCGGRWLCRRLECIAAHRPTRAAPPPVTSRPRCLPAGHRGIASAELRSGRPTPAGWHGSDLDCRGCPRFMFSRIVLHWCICGAAPVQERVLQMFLSCCCMGHTSDDQCCDAQDSQPPREVRAHRPSHTMCLRHIVVPSAIANKCVRQDKLVIAVS